jgi:hypothetical protein
MEGTETANVSASGMGSHHAYAIAIVALEIILFPQNHIWGATVPENLRHVLHKTAFVTSPNQKP